MSILYCLIITFTKEGGKTFVYHIIFNVNEEKTPTTKYIKSSIYIPKKTIE